MIRLRLPLVALVFWFASGAWAQDFSGPEALARGKAAAAGGDYAAALSLFERAAATLDGGSKGDAYLWAALAAERLGRQDEAERYKTLALAPVPAASERVDAKRSEGLEPMDTLPVEPVPVAAPAAEPKAPEAAQEKKPDAFQHFFGKKEDKAPAKGEPARPAEEKAAEPEKKGEVKDKPEVDAFQYFFGRREKKEKKDEPAESSEKPPV